jgi:hypothetical protein
MGNSFNFNGTYHVRMPHRDEYTFGSGYGGSDSPFSISLWYKYNTVDSRNAQGIVSKGFTGISQNTEYRIFKVSSDLVFTLYHINDPVNHNIKSEVTASSGGTPDFLDGNWHHIVATYDGSKDESGLTIYVDGISDGNDRTKTGSYDGMSVTSRDLCIGGMDTETGAIQSDWIDNVCIFDKLLIQEEVDFLYNGGNGTESLFEVPDFETTSLYPIDYYKAISGDSELEKDKWYVNYNKRHAFKIYSDYDPIEDV